MLFKKILPYPFISAKKAAVEHAEKTALITGATGGIGYEFCQHFARDQVNLILVARNQQKLSQLSKQLKRDYAIDVHEISVDLVKPNAVKSVYQHVQEKKIAVDYLLNNAGVGIHGEFSTTDGTELLAMITINITSLVQLTRLFLPDMLQRGRGHIVNVASLTAFQPGGPKAAVYYASKSFVLAFNRGLAVELKNTPITTTAFCPGPLTTHFSAQSGFASTRLYRYFSGNVKTQVKQAYQAMTKDKTTVVPGSMNKLLAFAGELPPRRIALAVNEFLLN